MSSSKMLSIVQHAKTSFFGQTSNEQKAPHIQDHVTGLRGVLVIQSLFWIYLQTFAPAMVYPSSAYQTNGPTWQYALRDIFCAPLWNTSLIYTWFIILSARTVCIPFLSNPCGTTFAGSLMRRNIRVGLSISVATAISILVFTQIENGYFETFNSILHNPAVTAPAKPQKPHAGFLSIYELLWVTRNWYQQAANTFWPSSTMWAPSLIYFQSYTVYIAMVILPFTRPFWHLQGCIAFAIGSYWLESWGWYSITGLMIADVAINPVLRDELKKGIKITENFRLPYFIPAVAFVILGFVQKYLWIAAFPSQLNRELILHPTIWTGDGLSLSDFSSQPYARLDDWMVVVGTMVLIELFQPLQKALSISPLTYLGRRSLSEFFSCLISQHTANSYLPRHFYCAELDCLHCRHQDVYQPSTDARSIDLGRWCGRLLFLHPIVVDLCRDLSHAC